MFAPPRSRVGSYQTMSVETGLANASPHKLIEMLYDGAIEAIVRARGALARGDVPTRTAAIGKAIRIVDEGLKAALDPRGGELSTNLDELYAYITRRLLVANLESSDAPLAEAAELLGQLRDGWKGIAPAAAAQ
ncbi:MAG: flagellar export chaperone FliS [Burkholderiaceae bacterium]